MRQYHKISQERDNTRYTYTNSRLGLATAFNSYQLYHILNIKLSDMPWGAHSCTLTHFLKASGVIHLTTEKVPEIAR